MAYSLVPGTLTSVQEAVDFNTTVTINKGALDPSVTSIQVFPLENTKGNILITTLSSSFRVQGQYAKNWPPVIYYEEFSNSGNSNVVVNDFDTIGSNLNFVISYIANSSPASLTANYAVKINNGANLYLTQVVTTNFTPGQTSLIANVAKGKF